MKLSTKQAAFAKNMYTAGSKTYGNGVESARAAQYAGNYNTLAQTAHKLVNNAKIKQAKIEICQETAKETGVSRERQMNRLDDLYDMAVDQKNPTAAKGIVAEQNEMLGFHRDKAPNTEKVDELLQRMGAEELAYRRAYAKQRTEAESESKPLFPRAATGYWLKVGQ